MARFLLFAVLFAMAPALNAQDYAWGRSFGGVGEDVTRGFTVDDMGNSYSTGYFTDNADYNPGSEELELVSNGFFDIYVQKLDPNGDLSFAFGIGGADFEYGTGIAVDMDGNIYVCGHFNGTVDFDPSDDIFEISALSGGDVFIAKYDQDGNFSWAKSMGGEGYEEPTGIATDASGNVFIGGYFQEEGDYDPNEGVFNLNSNGGQDWFAVKLNTEGAFQWAHSFGGGSQDLCLGVAASASGESFFTGGYVGSVDFDPSDEELILSSSAERDVFVAKFNTDGSVAYATSLGGSENEFGYGVDVDLQGRASVAGYFFGDFTAGSQTFLSQEFDDAFVAQLDPLGNVNWARSLQGNGLQIAYDVASGPQGQIALTGYFEQTVDFDPTDNSVFELTKESSEPFDAYYCILDQSGAFLEAAQFGGSNFIEYHGVGFDAVGNLFLSAAFQASVDANPSPQEVDQISSVAFRDSYVIRVNTAFSGTSTFKSLLPLEVYPNPSQGMIRLEGAFENKKNNTFTITDLSGKVVMQEQLTPFDDLLDISILCDGLYLLRINGYRTKKLMLKR